MSTPSSLAIIFWSCFATVVFAYLGYPLLISLFSRFFGRTHERPSVSDAELPVLSLLIAAHNEAHAVLMQVNAIRATGEYPRRIRL